MKSLYILPLLFLASIPVSAQEKHPHQHSEKTIESHSQEKEHSDRQKKSDDEHAHSNGEKAEHEERDSLVKTEDSEGNEGEHHKEVHEEGGSQEEEFSSSVGPGNAITAADERTGIQLSDKAQKALEIRLQPISESLPKHAIVTFKEETGIYRFRDGWFKLIEGKVIDAGNQRVIFRPRHPHDLKKGDQVVINGVPLLRVAELDAFAGEEAGHGH